jgi:DNA-binding CsgD family transcriptional regulator
MGPLYGVFACQDLLFVAIPAFLLVVIVGLCALLRTELLALFFPLLGYRDELDTSTLKNRCGKISKVYRLTAREEQILDLLAAGRNEPYIEQSLSISRATVKTHIAHIYQKTGVASRQDLLDLIHR